MREHCGTSSHFAILPTKFRQQSLQPAAGFSVMLSLQRR